MDKQAATKIIKDTFERPFDKGQFVSFAKNLLNKIDDSRNFTYQGSYIPDFYKPYIQTLERIGKYQDANDNKIDILIAQLKKETSLERARTRQRNSIAWYLNGSRGGELKDAALVAFVSPDNEDWRFSLVKMDYTLEETPGGKTKVKTELTPARRWSFLVGENESSHTAQSQLVDILADDKNDPTLPTLENAFNIEVATKEFFGKYRDLFLGVKEALEDIVSKDEKIRDNFAAKRVDTVNFSKRLLGQIVFLYFLQKKGWFGVGRDENWGTGPKNFLRLLFEKKSVPYQNFFNDILEPLFYEALRIDRRHDDDYYSRFNCKIPFLNGGLFDPINNYDWVHTDILFSDELFSNSQKTREGDVGTGILDVFDRYNFTVKEDEPLEKEVAIDPEMLGKVFENLLGVKDRKSKGTYYTPREIVHYMCQESLINYLDTAINTGDVPLAKTHPPQGKLFGKPDPEQMVLKTAQYKAIVPREDIETLIRYGDLTTENEVVALEKQRDIQNGKIKSTSCKPILKPSIEINAKLIDDKLDNIRVCDPAIGSGAFPVGMMHEIIRSRNTLSTYLPDEPKRTNYNFKRHAIQNCLYGVDIDPGAVEIAKLRLWLSLVVDEEDIRQIKPLPNLDYKIVCGNSLLGVEKNLFNLELFNNFENLKSLYFNETNTTRKQEYKTQIDDLINQITNNNQNFDFEVYFSEVFHKGNRGFDVVIGNPPYGFRNVLTKKEKTYFRKVEKIEFSSGDSAELFSKKSFNNLVKTNGILTFIIPKKSLYGDAWEGFRTDYWGKYDVAFLLDSSKAFEEVLLEANAFGLVKSTKDLEVKLNYLSKSDTVCEFARVKKEVVFMPNNTVQIYKALYANRLFEKIQANKAKAEMVEGRLGLAIGTDFFSDEPTKYKLLKGIDIERWGIKQHRYLRNRQNLNWGEAKKFLKPKVICQRVVAHIENPEPHIKITAAFDSEGIMITNTLIAFDLHEKINPRFWLAYLNSKFASWYVYNFIYSRAIRTMDFYNVYIQQMPIPKSAIENLTLQRPVIDVVDQILAITKDDDYHTNSAKQAKIKEYERQIDQMVYQLYDLTPEEIAIVEGSSAKDGGGET